MTNWDAFTWVIRRAGPGTGGNVIMKAGGKNEFTLAPKQVGAKTCYAVEKYDDVTEHWKNCVFYPRGVDKPVEWGLNPVDNFHWDANAEADLADFLAKTTFSTRRLEADFQVGSKVEAVTLYIAEGGVVGGKPLLIVLLRDNTPLALLESGSGTGDPK